jgi:hypothetical protein
MLAAIKWPAADRDASQMLSSCSEDRPEPPGYFDKDSAGRGKLSKPAAWSVESLDAPARTPVRENAPMAACRCQTRDSTFDLPYHFGQKATGLTSASRRN